MSVSVFFFNIFFYYSNLKYVMFHTHIKYLCNVRKYITFDKWAFGMTKATYPEHIKKQIIHANDLYEQLGD